MPSVYALALSLSYPVRDYSREEESNSEVKNWAKTPSARESRVAST